MIDKEKYQRYPNIYRVARELARCKHPDKVLDALAAMLASGSDLLHITVGEVNEHG